MRTGTEGLSYLLTLAEIRIADGVDTTHAATLDAVNCLRRYLTRKMDPEAPNDYWYAPDLEHYGGPYAELLHAEFDSAGGPTTDLPRYAPISSYTIANRTVQMKTTLLLCAIGLQIGVPPGTDLEEARKRYVLVDVTWKRAVSQR